MAEPQRRHRGEAQPLGGHHTPVAGDQHALSVHKHRVHEPELFD
jgi:hypothetical protein